MQPVPEQTGLPLLVAARMAGALLVWGPALAYLGLMGETNTKRALVLALVTAALWLFQPQRGRESNHAMALLVLPALAGWLAATAGRLTGQAVLNWDAAAAVGTGVSAPWVPALLPGTAVAAAVILVFVPLSLAQRSFPRAIGGLLALVVGGLLVALGLQEPQMIPRNGPEPVLDSFPQAAAGLALLLWPGPAGGPKNWSRGVPLVLAGTAGMVLAWLVGSQHPSWQGLDPVRLPIAAGLPWLYALAGKGLLAGLAACGSLAALLESRARLKGTSLGHLFPAVVGLALFWTLYGRALDFTIALGLFVLGMAAGELLTEDREAPGRILRFACAASAAILGILACKDATWLLLFLLIGSLRGVGVLGTTSEARVGPSTA